MDVGVYTSRCFNNYISILHCSVIRGVGEIDVKYPEPTMTQSEPEECPYLLLDVRDRDEYEAWHILTG